MKMRQAQSLESLQNWLEEIGRCPLLESARTTAAIDPRQQQTTLQMLRDHSCLDLRQAGS